MTGRRLCQVLGCDNPHHARGMCHAHYQVWRRGRRAPLVAPEARYSAAGPHNPPQAPAGAHSMPGGPVGPPYGWGHLPLMTDAEATLPAGSYWDWARVTWRPGTSHVEAVMRDAGLPWWELGVRVPWAASCQEAA